MPASSRHAHVHKGSTRLHQLPVCGQAQQHHSKPTHPARQATPSARSFWLAKRCTEHQGCLSNISAQQHHQLRWLLAQLPGSLHQLFYAANIHTECTPLATLPAGPDNLAHTVVAAHRVDDQKQIHDKPSKSMLLQLAAQAAQGLQRMQCTSCTNLKGPAETRLCTVHRQRTACCCSTLQLLPPQQRNTPASTAGKKFTKNVLAPLL